MTVPLNNNYFLEIMDFGLISSITESLYRSKYSESDSVNNNISNKSENIITLFHFNDTTS